VWYDAGGSRRTKTCRSLADAKKSTVKRTYQDKYRKSVKRTAKRLELLRKNQVRRSNLSAECCKCTRTNMDIISRYYGSYVYRQRRIVNCRNYIFIFMHTMYIHMCMS
jgi:hypothetical protein